MGFSLKYGPHSNLSPGQDAQDGETEFCMKEEDLPSGYFPRSILFHMADFYSSGIQCEIIEIPCKKHTKLTLPIKHLERGKITEKH